MNAQRGFCLWDTPDEVNVNHQQPRSFLIDRSRLEKFGCSARRYIGTYGLQSAVNFVDAANSVERSKPGIVNNAPNHDKGSRPMSRRSPSMHVRTENFVLDAGEPSARFLSKQQPKFFQPSCYAPIADATSRRRAHALNKAVQPAGNVAAGVNSRRIEGIQTQSACMLATVSPNSNTRRKVDQSASALALPPRGSYKQHHPRPQLTYRDTLKSIALRDARQLHRQIMDRTEVFLQRLPFLSASQTHEQAELLFGWFAQNRVDISHLPQAMKDLICQELLKKPSCDDVADSFALNNIGILLRRGDREQHNQQTVRKLPAAGAHDAKHKSVKANSLVNKLIPVVQLEKGRPKVSLDVRHSPPRNANRSKQTAITKVSEGNLRTKKALLENGVAKLPELPGLRPSTDEASRNRHASSTSTDSQISEPPARGKKHATSKKQSKPLRSRNTPASGRESTSETENSVTAGRSRSSRKPPMRRFQKREPQKTPNPSLLVPDEKQVKHNYGSDFESYSESDKIRENRAEAVDYAAAGAKMLTQGKNSRSDYAEKSTDIDENISSSRKVHDAVVNTDLSMLSADDDKTDDAVEYSELNNIYNRLDTLDQMFRKLLDDAATRHTGGNDAAPRNKTKTETIDKHGHGEASSHKSRFFAARTKLTNDVRKKDSDLSETSPQEKEKFSGANLHALEKNFVKKLPHKIFNALPTSTYTDHISPDDLLQKHADRNKHATPPGGTRGAVNIPEKSLSAGKPPDSFFSDPPTLVRSSSETSVGAFSVYMTKAELAELVAQRNVVVSPDIDDIFALDGDSASSSLFSHHHHPFDADKPSLNAPVSTTAFRLQLEKRASRITLASDDEDDDDDSTLPLSMNPVGQMNADTSFRYNNASVDTTLFEPETVNNRQAVYTEDEQDVSETSELDGDTSLVAPAVDDNALGANLTSYESDFESGANVAVAAEKMFDAGTKENDRNPRVLSPRTRSSVLKSAENRDSSTDNAVSEHVSTSSMSPVHAKNSTESSSFIQEMLGGDEDSVG